MRENTRPKLEVSYGITPKAFSHTAWNTAHTVNVHTTVALPQRQSKTELDDDVGRRKRRRAKMEIDEDLNIRRQTHSGVELTTTPEWWRRRQTKKKTDALWGGAKQQLSFSWQLPQSDEDEGRRRRRQTPLWGRAKRQLPFSWRLPQTDEDGTWYLTSHATRWLRSPWRM